MLAGRVEAAEVPLREGCALCQEHQQFAPLSNRASELADALYAQDRLEEAAEWAAVGRQHAAENDVSARAAWRSVSAKILARTGGPDAEKLAREAVDLTSPTDALNERARSLADLAEVLRLGGHHEDAQASLEQAVELYEQKGNVAAVALLRAETRRAPIGALRTD
jgi:tetratricopeptide (TPR) repeat protein